MERYKLSDNVFFVTKNGRFSYITDRGAIQDVRSFIASAVRNFWNHGLDNDDIIDEVSQELFVKMYTYKPDMPVIEFASYHVYRAIRKYIENFGNIRYGDVYGMSKGHFLRFFPKISAERSLYCSLDFLQHQHPPAQEATHPKFWRRMKNRTLKTAGNAKMNWEVVQRYFCGTMTGRELSAEYGKSPTWAAHVVENTCRRLRGYYEERR